MSYPAVTIPAGTSVAAAVDRFFVEHRFSGFPVTGDPALVIGEHEDVALLLERPAFGEIGRRGDDRERATGNTLRNRREQGHPGLRPAGPGRARPRPEPGARRERATAKQGDLT